MSQPSYPDANKLWDGKDNLLCWAAAVSNALFYTGWANQFNSADEVFALYRDSFSGKSGTAYIGVKFFLREILKTDVSIKDYCKLYPPSGLPFCSQMRGTKKCGIVGLRNDSLQYTHLTAFYDYSTEGSYVERNDPRQITHLLYSDSDDGELSNKIMNVTYNISTKRYDALNVSTIPYYIYSVMILSPPSA